MQKDEKCIQDSQDRDAYKKKGECTLYVYIYIIYIYIYMHVCICICMYKYIYIYVFTKMKGELVYRKATSYKEG